MKLGAEPRKMILLGGLLLVAAVLLYTNLFSGDDESASLNLPTPRPAPVVGTPPGTAEGPRPLLQRRPTEFRPSLKRRPEDALDPAKVDPTVRLDILAKLKNVTLGGTGRNIFEFGAAPPPPPPPAAAKRPNEPKIIPQAPPPSSPPPPVAISKPKAPPIPLKFYGLVSTPRGGSRRGFFLDGEDIVVAAEGETIKARYRVVRIGLNNVEMEDTQFSDRQTLPLEAPGA